MDLDDFAGDHRVGGGETSRARALLGVALLGAFAWWVVGLPSFSGTATVVVLLAGAAAVALGARRRRPPRPWPPAPGLGAWAGLVVALGVWQLVAFVQQPRADHPTLSSLTNGLLDSHPARAVAFVVWLMVARELARR